MASEKSNSSTSRPVAVVSPFRRSTLDNTEVLTASSLEAFQHTLTCDAATGGHQHPPQVAAVPSGHAKDSEDRQQPPNDIRNAATRLSEDAVDGRIPQCATGSSRCVADPDGDDFTTCPFYHGNISSDEAKRRLAGKSRGTYLLRDSQSTNFPLSISVRTSGRSGVTSLRIARDGGHFRLDSSEAHRALMPTFNSVPRLLQHFVAESDGGDGGHCVLVGPSSCSDEPLTLRQPLHRPDAYN